MHIFPRPDRKRTNAWRHRTCKPKARLFALLGLRFVVLKFKYTPFEPLTDDDQLNPLLPTFIRAPYLPLLPASRKPGAGAAHSSQRQEQSLDCSVSRTTKRPGNETGCNN